MIQVLVAVTVLLFFLLGPSDESSEDEPLINLEKKRHTETKTKASKKRDTTPKKLRKMPVSGKDSRGVRN